MRLILLSLIMCLFSEALLAQAVSVRTDEWYPMNGKPGAEPAGFLIDLTHKVFDTVDYKLMPWQRALEEVRAGKFDCVIGAYKEDAPGFVFPNENWGVDQTGVYIRAEDEWSYTDINSLLSRKVGIIKGYSYEDEVDALVKERADVFKSMSGVSALEKNFKKLLAGRVDTLIESAPVANAKILSMGLSNKVKRVGYTNDPSPMYIACSPANPKSAELIKKVDEVTVQLRASGELESIMNRYGLSDWK